MADDLKKLFGGRARVLAGVLSMAGKGKEKKEPVALPLPGVEKDPVVEQGDQGSFAEMYDQPDEEEIFFSESVVGTTLNDSELGVLAREKETAGGSTPHGRVNYRRPQEELDLHGMTAAQAALRVEGYVIDAHRRRLVVVRIITGKGNHSPRGPVLPEVVAATLNALKKRGLVGAVQYEKKGGSVLVFLAG